MLHIKSHLFLVEKVAIVDLAPTYLDGGKNLVKNFLSTSSQFT